MQTSEEECLAALRDAAQQLGESPTKAAYEELGLTPASATILRVVGSWNEAKERAGLSTAPSSGSRTGSKPDGVDLPNGADWKELSVDQRWHYRNRAWNTERTLRRRARIRSWLNDLKNDRGCCECDERNPACLDFHHENPDEKEMAVGKMVTYGHGKESLREEIAKCKVLCANCHRRLHYGMPSETANDHRDALRAWLYKYKQSSDGCRDCSETDPRCLVFHHDGEKQATVSKMVADERPREEIAKELERCVLLCSNCHRKRHFEPPEKSGRTVNRLRQE